MFRGGRRRVAVEGDRSRAAGDQRRRGSRRAARGQRGNRIKDNLVSRNEVSCDLDDKSKYQVDPGFSEGRGGERRMRSQ